MQKALVVQTPKDWVNAVGTFFPILLYVVVSAQFYVLFKDSITQTNIYNTFEAFGALAMGFVSDKFSRRRVAVWVHLGALALIPFIIYGKWVFAISLLVGFFYNPLPIIRAGLIDNLPHLSKIKIIALSFVVQYIPWAVYDKFVGLGTKLGFSIGWGSVFCSLIFALIFFHDKRDKKLIQQAIPTFKKSIHKDSYRKLWFTIAASVPAQLVYFFSDNLLEEFSENARFYSVLSFGSLIGALIATLYKRTPHIAVLTLNYGVSMMLAAIPLSTLFIYQIHAVSLPMMFIVFGCLGGFGIPFVYDVVLQATFVNYRGTACGLVDMIFSISSLVSWVLMSFLNLNLFWILMVIPLSFALSTFWQKRAEDPEVI